MSAVETPEVVIAVAPSAARPAKPIDESMMNMRGVMSVARLSDVSEKIFSLRYVSVRGPWYSMGLRVWLLVLGKVAGDESGVVDDARKLPIPTLWVYCCRMSRV